MDGKFRHVPFTGLRVVLRSSEAVPLAVVELRIIAAVVITRPSRLLPEERMSRHRLARHDAMLELPCPLELVQVFGADALEVLGEHFEELETARQQVFAGDV